MHARTPRPTMLFLLLVAVQRSAVAEPPPTVEARRGMVVSVNPEASDAGLKILRQGGNAVDAAVTTAFALAVTYPEAGNIGGGGFMMIAPAGGAEPVCIEYRETAPRAAGPDTLADDLTMVGHRVVGVPGTVCGLETAHRRFGRLPWPQLIEPAVALAEHGFAVDAALAAALNDQLGRAADFPEFRRVFGRPGGGRWNAGDRLTQPDLAATLRTIAVDGTEAFYRGSIAAQIVAEMRAGNGLITAADLADYRANVRRPIVGTYRGYAIFGTPPPSSGGTVIVETLNILEQFELRRHERFSPETVHLLAEAMKRAYCDRARYLGDPAFTEIPSHLTDKTYAARLAASIDPQRATPAATLAPEIDLADEGENTTHFSVVDADGMAVANTYTLQNSYGSKVVVRGAGFLLNNEMTDFNRRPGRTDRRGTVGTPANRIAPGKRMLSSQAPTFVFRDGRLLLVTGSPGGRTIPNTVLGVLVNILDYDMDVRRAVDAPRLHHQWFPDRISFEGFRRPEYAALVERLRALGHEVDGRVQGDAHSILVREGTFFGAADLRRTAGKAAGY